ANVEVTVAPNAPVQVGGNLIVNGSFESGTANWTDVNGNTIATGVTAKISAEDGSHDVALNTSNSGGRVDASIAQTVQGVENGGTYQLTFWVADTSATSNDPITVTWGGQVVYQGTPPNISTNASALPDWQKITIDVVGGAGDGSNQLVFKG